MDNCIWKGVEAIDHSMWCFRASCQKKDIDIFKGDSNDKIIQSKNPKCPYCNRVMQIFRLG